MNIRTRAAILAATALAIGVAGTATANAVRPTPGNTYENMAKRYHCGEHFHGRPVHGGGWLIGFQTRLGPLQWIHVTGQAPSENPKLVIVRCKF